MRIVDGSPHVIAGGPVVGDESVEAFAFGWSGLRHSASNQTDAPMPRFPDGRGIVRRRMACGRHRLDQPSGRRGGTDPSVPWRADHHHQQGRLPATTALEQAQLDASAVECVERPSIDDHRVDRRRSDRGLQAPAS